MKKIVWMVMIGAAVWVVWPAVVVERFDVPVYAAPLSFASAEDEAVGSADLPWLHVVVETKYAWLYQKSVGRAWTTVSRDDTTRVNVGELCIQLDCYWQHKLCETDTSYVEIQEIKRRVAVKKKKAIVSAWANQPTLEKITVEMEP